MKNAPIFSTVLLLLSVLFISQNAQAQWSQTSTAIYPTTLSKNVGIGTNNPLKKLHVNGDAMINNTLSFPNTVGNKISFWNSGPNNDFGIGLNYGVLQLYTAGQDKIAMGYGNANNFKETIRFMTGPGQIGFQNTLGNKISFWSSGPNNDFGIGLNTGVMQLYTAGQDKIAMGYGNANNFKETIRFMTGPGQIGFQNTLGNKISFWSSGPNNDFGIGLNTGVLQLYTAGQDKIAFGYGNSNNFTETMSFLTGSGQLGIGTTTVPTGYKLAVNGKVICTELKVQLKSAWPDYVFANGYKLKSLEEVEAHIQSENHLPGIPAAAEIEKEGLEVGDMQKKMMEKIEELTLYVIEINKENKALKQRVDQLEGNK